MLAIPQNFVTMDSAPRIAQSRVSVAQSIHTLPVETLASIFVCCLHPSPFSYKSKATASIAPRRIPIILASVCSHWRQVACNTSELWSTCWLRYDRPELHSLWLDRAGTHSLHLNGLLLPTPHNARPTEQQTHTIESLFLTQTNERQVYACALIPFLTSILPYMNQWASFIVYSDIFAQRSENIIPDSQFSAPQLELFRTLLTADPDRIGGAEPAYWTRAILQQAPRLQQLRVWERISTCASVKLHEYTNLVGLQLQDAPRLYYLLELLRNAPMMQSLKICGSIRDSYPKDGSLPLLPVHHPRLAELQISRFNDHGDLALLLDSLTLPALHSFDFHDFLWPPSRIRLVLALFERSGSSIRELHLSYGMLNNSQHFISILQSQAVGPSLRTLTLRKSTLRDEVIRFLTVDSRATTGNLPLLRKLMFSNVHSENSLQSSIADMVLSRHQKLNACERLRYFSYTIPIAEPYRNGPYEVDVRRLRAYAASTTGESAPLVVCFSGKSCPDNDNGESEGVF